jgi:hypothetical protein
MQRIVRLSGLLLIGLTLIVPSFAGDPKKDDKKPADPEKKKDAKGKDEPAKDKDEEKVVYGVHFTGRLTQLDPNSQKDFTVQVTTKVAELDQGQVNRMADLQRQMLQQQQSAATARTLQQRQQALNQMQNIQNQMLQARAAMYRYKDVNTDYKLRAGDKIKVRSVQPPVDYDEKGNLKKYTAEELKALRGTSGLPGYTAEYDSLRAGQVVHVYLAKNAHYGKGGEKKGAEKKAKKVDELDDETALQARPEVVMIMIIQEPVQK